MWLVAQPAAIEVRPDLLEADTRVEGSVGYIVSILNRWLPGRHPTLGPNPALHALYDNVLLASYDRRVEPVQCSFSLNIRLAALGDLLQHA